MIDEIRYERWIRAIAKDITTGTCPFGILDHIQKHASQDLIFQKEQDCPNWRRWSASMHNLLAIFDRMFLEYEMTTAEQLERLQAHYESNPAERTPEPK